MMSTDLVTSRTVSLERTSEVHSLAAEAATTVTGSEGNLKLVALCMEPATFHSEANVRFNTQAIMDSLSAAFHASKANPDDKLCFIDIARMNEVEEMLPKPWPPYRKAEKLVMEMALGPRNISLRIRENLQLLQGP